MRVNKTTLKLNNKKIYGNHNSFFGDNLTIIGDNNKIFGKYAKVEGNNNTVTGDDASVTGEKNRIFGENAYIEGEGNKLYDKKGKIKKEYVNVRPREDEESEEEPRKKQKKLSEDEPEEEFKFVEGPPEYELDNDVEAKDDDPPENVCIICYGNRRICVTVPCDHMGVCIKCARTLCFGLDDRPREVGEVKCPLCNESVTQIKRIYI